MRQPLAAFLACQPVFWIGRVALAQASASPYPTPPSDPAEEFPPLAAPRLSAPAGASETDVHRQSDEQQNLELLNFGPSGELALASLDSARAPGVRRAPALRHGRRRAGGRRRASGAGQTGAGAEPGSWLVAPKQNFVRSEAVQIALGDASVLVTGVTAVLTART